MSTSFYAKLPATHIALAHLIHEKDQFVSVPEDWVIVMTDIRHSTEHFVASRYQDINLIAVSSISIVLNVAKEQGTVVPFVYGGDGATMIVPPKILRKCVTRLATLRKHAKEQFSMDLRVCSIPIEDIHEAGHDVLVAKLHVSDRYKQAVFLGTGLTYAEKLMKEGVAYELPMNTRHHAVDLSGLECKWNALFPPKNLDEVLCLIVKPVNQLASGEVFASVLQKINDIYGSFEDRHPIEHATTSPTTNWRTVVQASKLKYGRRKFIYIIPYVVHSVVRALAIWYASFVDKIVNRDEDRLFVTASDTLKIDDTLKTIFAGTKQKRKELLAWLDTQEQKGVIVYGMSISESSVMTCYISHTTSTHVRFLDGFGGGYTRAAVAFKKKIKK